MPRPRPKEVCHDRSLPVRKRSAFRLRAAWMHRMRGALLFRVRVPARAHPLLRPLGRKPARAARGAIGARADLSAEEDMERRGTIFRQLLGDEPYLYTGGIYSPLDAQIAESAGMKSIYLSGYSVAMLNGWPDMGLLTMTEVAKTASMVASAVDVPIIADADDGYGNALSTMRTVQEFVQTGVAAGPPQRHHRPPRSGHNAGYTRVWFAENNRR